MVTQAQIEQLKKKINEADAIVVGGASGMSAASGFVFYYQDDKVYRQLAGHLAQKYHLHNLFDLFYDRRLTRGEHWGSMIRMNQYIYDCYTGETYKDLAELLRGKDYYIVTTNQDAQFFRTFPAERITRLQGDWRYWQSSRPCHDRIYDNEAQVKELARHVKDDVLPDDLIPRCPHCGGEMAPWVRGYTFLEGEFYQNEMKRYMDYLQRHAQRKTLFLELGVGMMTPMFIKEPFMNMVYQWSQAYYVTINPQHAIVPREIAGKSLAIQDDIAVTLKRLLGKPVADSSADNASSQFNPSRIY